MSSTSPFLRAFAIAALVGSLALASPSYAAPDSSASSGTSTSGKQSMAQNVEQRIQTLHDKLQISPDQESAWNDVAQAMRDNEANIHQAIAARYQNAKSMNAIEDLESYQKIAQAHADGLGKLISSFESLYDSMSPAQQKNADEVFGRFEGHRGAMKASARGKKAAPASTPDNE